MPKIALLCRLLPVSLAGFYLVSSPSVSLGQNRIIEDPGAAAPLTIKLDGIAKGALVTLLMRDVYRFPYVISADVLQDRSPVSVNLSIPRDAVQSTVIRYLIQLGLRVSLVKGVAMVSKAPAGSRYDRSQVPSGSPLLPGQVSGPGVASGPSLPGQASYGGSFQARPRKRSVAVVTPVHLSPVEFADPLRVSFPGLDVAARESSRPGDSTVRAASAPDQLVISGEPVLIEHALRLVMALDRPKPVVSLSVLIVEVRTDKSRGSALQVLSNALAGAVRPSSYPGLPVGPQALSITLGGITAVASAVREDSRFEILSEPSLAVESGAAATINAGSSVPTLGAVSFTDGGQSVQSVEYRDSGIVLEVQPTVRGEVIHMAVKQERSSFSRTTTGVNDSPTLDQTALSTVLTFKPGETVALAGIAEKSEGRSKRGIFGGLLRARSDTDTTRQTVIVIQATVQPGAHKQFAPPVIIGPFDASDEASPSGTTSPPLNPDMVEQRER